MRNIVHLLFMAWPDFGVPSSTMDFLEFISMIKEETAAAVKALGDGWKVLCVYIWIYANSKSELPV